MYSLSHVGIIAEDPVTLAKWYKDVLGFEIILEMKKEGRPPIFFLRGEKGSYIEILPSIFTTHIAFVVDDFDKALKDLESKEVIFKEVRETNIGWKIGYFEDPQGNLLEIVYRPTPLEKSRST